jgi:2-polyprenyl-6-methoxyphenol hydroxylase-like FAD-dependent oxidoreductase
MSDHDVVVVGARLAGTTLAAELARRGRDVVVVDRARFPSDTLSTHVLFSGGVEELRHMGALERILALDPSLMRWVQITIEGEATISERWGAIGETDYVLCIPRLLQDEILVDVARERGADVREGWEFQDLIWSAGRVVGARCRDADGGVRDLRAKLVVGADGRRSAVAARAGAWLPYRSSKNGRGLVFRYLDDPQVGTRLNETASQWRDGRSVCMTFPSAPRPRMIALVMGPASDVARARKDPEGVWAEFLRRHPGFAERIAGAGNEGKLRSTADVPAYFRASSGPGWALAGDSGHFKDPVIGNGQRDAVRMGRTLGEAVEPVLDDPPELDAAARRWERSRDEDCLAAYHFANLETRIQDPSLLLAEIGRCADGSGRPDVGDAFNRIRSAQEVISPGRVAGLLARAVIRDPRSAPGLAREAIREGRIDLAIRRERRAGRFRATATVAGSEHPGAVFSPPPRRRVVDPAEAYESAPATAEAGTPAGVSS